MSVVVLPGMLAAAVVMPQAEAARRTRDDAVALGLEGFRRRPKGAGTARRPR